MNLQDQNNSTASGVNFDVKEQNFKDGEYGVPIAGRYAYPRGENGSAIRDGSAIGEYKIPPSSGTYVLGSINGTIQWIATESC